MVEFHDDRIDETAIATRATVKVGQNEGAISVSCKPHAPRLSCIEPIGIATIVGAPVAAAALGAYRLSASGDLVAERELGLMLLEPAGTAYLHGEIVL